MGYSTDGNVLWVKSGWGTGILSAAFFRLDSGSVPFFAEWTFEATNKYIKTATSVHTVSKGGKDHPTRTAAKKPHLLGRLKQNDFFDLVFVVTVAP